MTKSKKKDPKNFYCQKCHYFACKQSLLDRHFLTAKHKMDDNGLQKGAALEIKNVEKFMCECGKEYKFRQGLFKHKKKCPKNEEINLFELFKNQMNESKEIKKFIQEQHNMIICQNEQIKKLSEGKITNHIINNNCFQKTTNKFNLNFFLNEQCKDALNLADFISSLSIKIIDLENTSKVGFVDGISQIILKGLKELDIYKRPLHCSDLKREILYIKNEDKWLREDEDKVKLKHAINQISYKNIKQIPNWVAENPECLNLNSSCNEQYMKLLSTCMTEQDKEEHINNLKKVISKLAKEVSINKLEDI